MNKISLLTIVCGFGVSFGASANTEVVNCQDDIDVDRPAISAAIADTSNSKVLIKGTCQLDGETIFVQRSDIVITGEGTDCSESSDSDSGDCTILRGLLDAEGFPQEEPFGAFFNNRLMRILTSAAGDDTENVTVKNIRFENGNRTTAIGSLSSNSNLCRDTGEPGGVVRNITIKDNVYRNSVRGPQLFGAGVNIVFKNNDVVALAPMLVAGGSTGCFILEGEVVQFPGPTQGEVAPAIPIVDGICQNNTPLEDPLTPIVVRDKNNDGDINELDEECIVCDDDFAGIPGVTLDGFCGSSDTRIVGDSSDFKALNNKLVADTAWALAGRDTAQDGGIQAQGFNKDVLIKGNDITGNPCISVIQQNKEPSTFRITKNKLNDCSVEPVNVGLRSGAITVGGTFSNLVNDGLSGGLPIPEDEQAYNVIIKNNDYSNNVANVKYLDNLIRLFVIGLPRDSVDDELMDTDIWLSDGAAVNTVIKEDLCKVNIYDDTVGIIDFADVLPYTAIGSINTTIKDEGDGDCDDDSSS